MKTPKILAPILAPVLAPILIVLLVAFVFVTPVGPVPGFLIGGAPTEAPVSWGDTSDIHEIKLEVPGLLPRVVIIWVVQAAGELHIVGARDSGWVTMLKEGGPVRMRMRDSTYSLKANLVNTDREPVMEAYVAKYRPDYPEIVNGFPSLEDAAGSFSVFRLIRQ